MPARMLRQAPMVLTALDLIRLFEPITPASPGLFIWYFACSQRPILGKFAPILSNLCCEIPIFS